MKLVLLILKFSFVKTTLKYPSESNNSTVLKDKT